MERRGNVDHLFPGRNGSKPVPINLAEYDPFLCKCGHAVFDVNPVCFPLKHKLSKRQVHLDFRQLLTCRNCKREMKFSADDWERMESRIESP